MKKIILLNLLFFSSLLSFAQVSVTIKLKNNQEINDSVKQIGIELISLKTDKKYNLNEISDIKVFNKKNIPFRSFEIKKRDEKTLGELFCFFILETILIGQSMNLNPYDQPAVELIKIETKKFLI